VAFICEGRGSIHIQVVGVYNEELSPSERERERGNRSQSSARTRKAVPLVSCESDLTTSSHSAEKESRIHTISHHRCNQREPADQIRI
jgi:hypothetical protein